MGKRRYFIYTSIVIILLQLGFKWRQAGGLRIQTFTSIHFKIIVKYLTGQWMTSLTKLLDWIAVHYLILSSAYMSFPAAAVFFLSPQNSSLGQILDCHLWGHLQISQGCYCMNNQLSHLRNSLCSTSLNADSCCCYNRSLYRNL